VAEVGDRIMVAAAKGAPSKKGAVVAKSGSMLTVEWDDGHQSFFYPAPGSVTVNTAASSRSR
jgi:hypothetical protein